MNEHVSDLERRLTDLQFQIDRLSLGEERVQRDSAARIQDLQRVIEHEWTALRQIHEEPVKQLREQAASLTEVAVSAATSALTGFDRAEARLVGIETNLHSQLKQLSDEVRLAVAELRTLTGRDSQGLATPAAAWPLDGVVRLHNQLRGTGEGHPSGPPAAGAGFPAAIAEAGNGGPAAVIDPRLQLPEATTALSHRMETLERALNEGQTEIREVVERGSRSNRLARVAFALLAVGIAASVVLVTQLQRQVGEAFTQAAQAQEQTKAVTNAANERIAEARADAQKQIAQAREAADKAQTISDVLAAPDLVRYTLIGRDGANQLSAQALWSRSRGFVFSGSRLPPPPPNAIYQIWLLSATEAVSAGVFTPDAAGRFTLVTDTPPRVPPPLAGVSVTIEHAGGGDRPTGETLLARIEPR